MTPRDLLTDPLCNASEVGHAIPDSPHATSVCLPTWEQVVGYEEGDPEILGTFEAGYPRFFVHPITRMLFSEATENFAREGERSLVFPDLSAAWRCAAFIKEHAEVSARIEALGHESLTVVSVAESGIDAALKYWRFSGEIVSSRQAEAALEEAESVDPTEAITALRDRISEINGQPADHVFLFPSGMAAIFAVHRAVGELFPDEARKTAQVEFPYVDSLCVQREFGPGVIDLSNAPSGGVAEVRELLGGGEKLAAIYSELPSNPLLRTADLTGLAEICREEAIPLLVDDTVGTAVNVDAFRFADVVTTSLTKLFSGVGDVMAGAVVVRADSSFCDHFLACLRAGTDEHGSAIFGGDAIVLEENSRDFTERVAAVNTNALEVFEFLSEHPAVDHVWYPKTETPEFYQAAMREGAGFSGLISLSLKDAPTSAPRFYDRLDFTKGPSLGTNFSLACPYTLLAHYEELDWARERGVPAELIRLWIGIEPASELITRLEKALS